VINISDKNEFPIIINMKSIYSESLLRSEEEEIEKIGSDYTWNYSYSIGKISI
jgi:hypothetical protein